MYKVKRKLVTASGTYFFTACTGLMPSVYYEYLLNGARHRIDGPAIQGNKFKVWYRYGRVHRLDGPAFIRADGKEEWCIDDIEYSKEEWENIRCLKFDIQL